MSSTVLGASRGFAVSNPSECVARLDRLGPAGRLAQYRAGKLTITDLSTWGARYPDEVPTVNGEFEWIGLSLADLD
jgi:hypothetical protein